MGFLSKIKNNMRKRVSKMPRGNMGSDFRMPQKRGGGFGNLREAIRRLKEQGDMGMPRRPSTPGMGSPGGTPGFYAPGGRFNPGNIGGRIGDGRMRAMPIGPGVRLQGPQLNFGMEQMPAEIDISALERLPMGEQPMPPMPQDLPEVESVGMMPEMGMGDMQPRMMMQAGDEVSPEQEIFSLQTQLENLQEQLRLDRSYNDDQAVINTSAEMAAIQRRIQEILQEGGRTISDMDRQQTGRTISDLDRGRTISDMDRQMGFKAAGSIGSDDQGNPVFPEYSGGGYVNGYAEGDEVMMEGNEIESMLSGMDSGEEEAMGELEQMAPEMEMIDQLVMMVAQMIQQGAGEEEVIGFLREQGLDDEDIGTVLQLVAEMSETEEMAEDQIGNELAQLG